MLKEKKIPLHPQGFFSTRQSFFFFILLFVKRLILLCVTFSPLLKTTLTWIEVVLAFFEDSNWILFLSVSFRIIFFLLTLSQFRFEKIYIFTQTHLSMWFLSVFFWGGGVLISKLILKLIFQNYRLRNWIDSIFSFYKEF